MEQKFVQKRIDVDCVTEKEGKFLHKSIWTTMHDWAKPALTFMSQERSRRFAFVQLFNLWGVKPSYSILIKYKIKSKLLF